MTRERSRKKKTTDWKAVGTQILATVVSGFILKLIDHLLGW